MDHPRRQDVNTAHQYRSTAPHVPFRLPALRREPEQNTRPITRAGRRPRTIPNVPIGDVRNLQTLADAALGVV